MTDNLTHAQKVAIHMQKMAEIAAKQKYTEQEELDDDSYNLNGKDIPGICFNVLNAGDIKTSSWISEENSILFLIKFTETDIKLVCTNIEILKNSLNEETRIMFACTSQKGWTSSNQEVFIDKDNEIYDRKNYKLLRQQPIKLSMDSMDLSREYIPFTYDFDGIYPANGYILRSQIEEIINRSEQTQDTLLFTLEFLDTISVTVSKNNTILGTELQDAESNAHCQSGTSIIIYNVIELPKPEPINYIKKSLIDIIIEDRNSTIDRNFSILYEKIHEIGMEKYKETIGSIADKKLEQMETQFEYVENIVIKQKIGKANIVLSKETGELIPDDILVEEGKSITSGLYSHNLNFEEMEFTDLLTFALIFNKDASDWEKLSYNLEKIEVKRQCISIAHFLNNITLMTTSIAYEKILEMMKSVESYDKFMEEENPEPGSPPRFNIEMSSPPPPPLYRELDSPRRDISSPSSPIRRSILF